MVQGQVISQLCQGLSLTYQVLGQGVIQVLALFDLSTQAVVGLHDLVFLGNVAQEVGKGPGLGGLC